MRHVQLGRTGIVVSELCHGTLILGRLQARLSTEDGAAALRRSYELGVRFYDTAQAYDSYRHLRRFLAEVRPDDVVVASKSQARTAAEMRAAVEEARRELGLERIDIMHLHGVADAEDLRARAGALAALRDCRERGHVRAIGMTSHGVAAFAAAEDLPEIEVVHPVFNRQSLGLIHGSTGELHAVLGRLKRQGRGIYAMKMLAGGHYVREMERAFAYYRATALCDAAAVGMKTPAEVEMDVHLFEEGRLTDEERERLRSFSKHLIVYDRCVRCGACVEACQQGAMSLGPDKAVNDPARCVLCGYCAAVCPEFVIRVI